MGYNYYKYGTDELTKSPINDIVSNALSGYEHGVKASYAPLRASYIPQQIEADIFAKKFGPMATLATTPMFLQNPQFQEALGHMVSKYMNLGEQGGSHAGNNGGAHGGGNTYAGQTRKDIQEADVLANKLTHAGKVQGGFSSAGGGLVNYLGDLGNKIISHLPGGLPQQLVNPELAENKHQLDTFLEGLKNRSLQTQYLNPAQAEEVFRERKDENPKQRLSRIKRVAPGLFQQGDDNPQAQNPTMDAEDKNNNDNRDLSFAADLAGQIKAKTGHDISPDLIFNYMQRTPGKISVPLLLKAAGVR